MSGYRWLSEVYEHLADDFLHALYKQLINRYTTACSVLEVGCGTAPLIRDLAREGYTATGMDLSTEMLAMAAYYAGEEGVDLTLFHHDARQPFKGSYQLILMPADVINHLNNFSEVALVFKQVTAALKKDGILMFDYLHQQYMQTLIGHEEAVQIDEHHVHWRVEGSELPDAHRHVVTLNAQVETHVSRTYAPASFATLYQAFEVLETVVLDHRNIIVLRKR